MLLYLLIAGVVVFVLLPFVPYGRNHTNPPTISEPAWDSPQTRQIAKGHCFQFHSSETDRAWYSDIAPASWLIYWDVERARSKFNLSERDTNPGFVDDLIDAVEDGKMPPIQYWIFHPHPAWPGIRWINSSGVCRIR
jgi:hypothetical protein